LRLAILLAVGLTAGGCSLSWQLDSLFGKKDDVSKGEATGSIAQPVADKVASDDLPAEIDLAYAKAAASDVLSRGGTDTSAPWENPRTGARGTVTPIAQNYSESGFTCRDFLASYVRDGNESWLQGEACRVTQGRWEVRDLKPWRRS
jgi:surface antigen